ncbi:hypothetical protein GGR28_002245 [Lewinella aquimaris]|uniref:Uncharacterized protein n=1 Tax=Neolewinella aquimaris TaxID=1835722 RepID=A0A840E3F8_9BACT|nr:hypothetical protein [Neolewinella aquimaris]MBB4079620.1 hypothetical protein [Neolewinella aquimaris]
MKTLFPLLVLLFLFLGTGCVNNLTGDEIDEFEEEYGEGELSARIDGRSFRGRIAWAEKGENVDNSGLSALSIIGGDIRNDEDGEAIYIVALFESPTVPASGSYSMNEDCFDNDIPCVWGAYGFSYQDGEIDATFESDDSSPGSLVNLTYETYERDEGPALRGTFEMVLVSADDADVTLRITDGKFDVPISE